MDEYFCPNCNAILNNQDGFDPSCGTWTCTSCGKVLMDDDVYDGDSFEGIAWFCDSCGALLNRQSGFSDSYGSWVCTKCGHRNGTTEDDIVDDSFLCPKCGATLNEQWGFNKYDDDYECSSCGAKLHHDYSDDKYRIVEEEDGPTCPNCGAKLKEQFCFADYQDDWECTECGAQLHHNYTSDPYEVVEDNSEDEGDDESYCWENRSNRQGSDFHSSSSNYSFPSESTKSKGFLKRHWKGTFLGTLILFAVIATTFILWEFQKLIPMGYDSSEFIGMNYETVVADLEASGFTNVRTESTEDLEISDIAEENQVYEIEVLRKTEFNADTKYPYDIRVVVKYHTLKLIIPPLSYKEAKGANYQDIISEFENAGFVNIHTDIKYDVVLGWFAKDGEIENVSIDGEKKFDTTTKIRPDAEIMVTYHTYKSNKP